MADVLMQINQAKEQGYSDDEIYDHLASSNPQFKAAKEQGYGLGEVVDHLSHQFWTTTQSSPHSAPQTSPTPDDERLGKFLNNYINVSEPAHLDENGKIVAENTARTIGDVKQSAQQTAERKASTAGIIADTAQHTINDPAFILMKPLPKEVQEQYPTLSAIYNTVADNVNSFTSPKNLAIIAATGGAPAIAQKLVALGFGLDAAKGTAQSLIALKDEKDPTRRTQLATQAVIGGLFSELIGTHVFGEGKPSTSITPDEASEHLKTVSDNVLNSGLEMARTDPKLYPYPNLIADEIARRKQVQVNDAAVKADDAGLTLTAQALKQTVVKPPEIIPAQKEGELANEKQPASEGGEPDSNGVKPSSTSEQPASQAASIQTADARQPEPDQGKSGDAEQVLSSQPEKEVITNEKENANEVQKETIPKKEEVATTGGSTPPLKPAIYNDGTIHVAENPNDSHADIIQQASKKDVDATDGAKGFVDENGKFVNRIDAANIALKKGVIDQKTYDASMQRGKSGTFEDFINSNGLPDDAATRRSYSEMVSKTDPDKGLHSEDLIKAEKTETPDPEKTTGIKNELTDAERKRLGMPERQTPETRSYETVLAEAKQNISENQKMGSGDLGNKLVSEIKSKPRPLTDLEDATLTLELSRRQQFFDKSTREVNDAKTPDELLKAKQNLAAARDQMSDVLEAAESAGTANARGLAARRMMIKQDLSLAKMEARERATVNNGKPLSDEQAAQIKSLHDQLAAARKQIEAHEDAKKASQANDYFRQLVEETKKDSKEARKKGSKLTEFLDDQAEKARQRLKTRGARSMAGLDPVELVDHAIIGASYIAKGIKNIGEWSTQMIKDFGESIKPYLPDLFERSKAYHDAHAKLFVEDTPESKTASVDDVLKKAATEKDLNPQTVYNLARAHVNAGVEGFDAVMKAVHADLAKIHDGITEREVRDAFSGYGEVKFPSKEADLVKLREYRRIGQLVSGIEDAQRGEAPKKSGQQRDKPTQDVREKMKELQATMERMGIETTTPEEQLASRNQARATALRNSIEDLDKQLRTGEKPEKGKTVPNSEEVERLQSERDAMKAKLKEIEDEKNPPKTPEQMQLERYKKAIINRTADLQDKLNKGDYSKRVVNKTVVDEEAFKLKAKEQALKNQFERRLNEGMWKNKPLWEKALIHTAGLARAAAIGGYHTFGKLFSWDAFKFLETPVREGIGAVMEQIPGLRRITKTATAESGQHAQSLAKFYTKFFTDGMKEAARTLMNKGDSNRRLEFPKGEEGKRPVFWYDYVGLSHSAMKAPLVTGEMALRLEKLTASAIANGLDPSNEMVAATIRNEASKYADRAILQENNAFANWINSGFEKLEKPDQKTGESDSGKLLTSTIIKTFLTKGVVRTPLNFFVRSLEYNPIVSLTRAAYGIAKAYIKGIDNLKPQEANVIHRLLVSGAIGTAATVYGVIQATKPKSEQTLGGFYQPNKKKTEEEVPYNSIRIDGKIIPHSFVHNPFLEQAQFAYTMAQVALSRRKKSDEEKQGYAAGALFAVLAQASNAPIVSPIFRTLENAAKGNTQQIWWDEITGLIPQLVQNLAEDTDSGVKRDPQSLGDAVKMAIPGLRQQVPEKSKPFSIKKTRGSKITP